MLYCVDPSCNVTVTSPLGIKSTDTVLKVVAIVSGIKVAASSKPVRKRSQVLFGLPGLKKLSLYWPGAALI